MHTEKTRLAGLRDDSVDRNAMAWALAGAVALHLFFLLLVSFPDATPVFHEPSRPTEPFRISRVSLPPPPLEPRQRIENVTRKPAMPVPFPPESPPAPVREAFVVEFEVSRREDSVFLGDPQPPVAATGPLYPVGNVTLPVLIQQSKLQPVYPELARGARIEGRVTLQAIVLADGSVAEVTVLHCISPEVGFEEAAIEAIEQWRYEPALLNGRPVDVYLTVVVEFTLF